MRPRVVCLMLTSIDGRLETRRWSESPDGIRTDWTTAYNQVHEALGSEAWIVGRVTMAEMIGASAPPVPSFGTVVRPHYFATPRANRYAIALDPSGKLHFSGAELDGDHLVVLLGSNVTDAHLAELASCGVSYIVAENATIDLGAMLDLLGTELGIRLLALEGGGGINGSFMAAGLVDEISLLVAPTVDGREGARATFEHGESGLASKVQLSLLAADRLDHGVVHLRYAVTAGRGHEV